MEPPAAAAASPERALRSKALSSMTQLQQGIVHTEQKLQQCLGVLGRVQADVRQYKSHQLAEIQVAYASELQALTEAFERQVRELEARTQQRVAQVSRAADAALKQAGELLLQELGPPAGPQAPQQQQQADSTLKQLQLGAAPAAQLPAQQHCMQSSRGSVSRSSSVDDVPTRRSDCGSAPRTSPAVAAAATKGTTGGPEGLADIARPDQGAGRPLLPSLLQHDQPRRHSRSGGGPQAEPSLLSLLAQPQSCTELLATLGSRRGSTASAAAAASAFASACRTPRAPAGSSSSAFGTPAVSAATTQLQEAAPPARPCPPPAPRQQQQLLLRQQPGGRTTVLPAAAAAAHGGGGLSLRRGSVQQRPPWWETVGAKLASVCASSSSSGSDDEECSSPGRRQPGLAAAGRVQQPLQRGRSGGASPRAAASQSSAAAVQASSRVAGGQGGGGAGAAHTNRAHSLLSTSLLDLLEE